MADYAYNEQEENQERRLKKEVARALRNAQIEQQKKIIVRSIMEDKAYERLMNIRASNQELYSRLADMIISLAQNRQLRGKMTEQQFVEIMSRISERPESSINFKRK